MSVYHPTAEEISASMGVPMEGFFDGAEAVLSTPAPPAAHKAPAKTPTPSAEPVPREGTHVEGVGETTPLPAERFASSEGATPSAVAQTEITPPILPLVISSSDPFADISQAAKDSASLVVTPSSIPGSATRGPDPDLSSEGSADIFEDPDDVPVLKRTISDSDEEGSASLVVTPSSIPSSATRGPDLDLSSKGSADIFEDPDDVPVLKRTISDSDEEGNASSEPNLMGMYLPSSSSPFFVFVLRLHTHLPICRNF